MSKDMGILFLAAASAQLPGHSHRQLATCDCFKESSTPNSIRVRADKLLGVVGADAILHQGLERVRALNRTGMNSVLSELDERYLQVVPSCFHAKESMPATMAPCGGTLTRSRNFT